MKLASKADPGLPTLPAPHTSLTCSHSHTRGPQELSNVSKTHSDLVPPGIYLYMLFLPPGMHLPPTFFIRTNTGVTSPWKPSTPPGRGTYSPLDFLLVASQAFWMVPVDSILFSLD